jgi:glutamate-5-semialdehyde dehydrogenase
MKALLDILVETKKAGGLLGRFPGEKRREVLLALADGLVERKGAILEAVEKDVAGAVEAKRGELFLERLRLTAEGFGRLVEMVRKVAESEDCLGEIIEERTLEDGVRLKKVRVSLGVIAVVFDSEPSVALSVFAVCFKGGNSVVWYGEPGVSCTSAVLLTCVHEALAKCGLPSSALVLLDNSDSSTLSDLLQERGLVDVVIPRGGHEYVQRVSHMSRIPVLYHMKGGARIYVDQSADVAQAVRVCVNAKVSNPSICNSVDTLVVHELVSEIFLPFLAEELHQYNIGIKADLRVQTIITAMDVTEEDYHREFLKGTVAIKLVRNVDEAIAFVESHTRGHTEGILATDPRVIQKFVTAVDAAAIFVNCSPRLHDGEKFGFVGDVGISTGKLHARGPVGVRELTTYKWVAYGDGQVRA